MSSKKPKQGYKLIKSLFGKYEEIPEDWNSSPISHLVENDTGEWGIDNQEPIPDGYIQVKILRNTDFKKWDIEKGKQAPIRLISKNKRKKVILNEGDILIETSGGGPDQPLGRTIIIDEKSISNSSLSLTFSNFLARFRTKNNNSEFLNYFLQRYYQSGVMKNFEKQTTNLRNFDLKFFLKRFHVFFPNSKEQEKIVSILSNVDDLIYKYNSVIEINKNLKTGLMQQLLTKGIGHKKFKKVKLGFGKIIEIPESWMIEKLGNVSEMIVPMRDKPKIFDGNIPWLRIEDLDGKYVSDSKSNQRVSFSTVKEMNLKIFPIGTVLCSCSATIGECAITTKELITNQRFIGISPDEKLDKEFLYYFLKTKKDDLIKIGTGGVHLYISRDFFEKFPITIPPINEQEKIAFILSKIDSKIDDLESKKVHLESLKKGLMQELLSGQIRVKI